MNIGRITSVLVNKVRHLQIPLGHVVRNIDRFSGRQRPVLEIFLPSSRFQDSRSIFWQVDGVYPVVNRVQSERRGT